MNPQTKKILLKELKTTQRILSQKLSEPKHLKLKNTTSKYIKTNNENFKKTKQIEDFFLTKSLINNPAIKKNIDVNKRTFYKTTNQMNYERNILKDLDLLPNTKNNNNNNYLKMTKNGLLRFRRVLSNKDYRKI